MNWSVILTSMLPEHLLLVGMLAILGLEIRSGHSRDGFALAVLSVGAARWGEHESDKQRPATLHGVHRRKAHHLPHLRTHTRRRGAQPKLVARQRARWGWELTLNRVPHCLCNGAFPASVQPPRPSTALPTRAGVAPTGAFRSFEAVEGQQPVRLLASVAPPRAPQCCKRFAAKTVGARAHRVHTRRRPHAAPLVGPQPGAGHPAGGERRQRILWDPAVVTLLEGEHR